ncbi:hypothetical protein [Paenibacillus segetis]|uniref:Uncharacterized protein n=1 Tax=Paenibacillus segetis TaxID=1325360 RepID=A0ABQ1YQ27_9BACL|nr:hypothetical protein [Paenibacillus segetis]GGH34397.1 hypothetical protein GCM10008013_40090 [Paenibacillus segetis]
MSKKFRLKSLLLIGFSVAIGLVSPLLGAAPKANAAVMHTSPPPIEISPYSMFDPNFVSLDYGAASISDKGAGKISISGETNAKKTVSTIGVKVVVQRWTGTAWVDYYTGNSATKSNNSYILTSEEKTVSTGYYYRTVSTHWTINGGVREEGTKTSSSIAVS